MIPAGYAMTKIDMLGLKFDNLSLQESLDTIETFIQEGRPRQIFTPNAALVVWAHQDSYLRDVYNRTDMLTADGFGVTMASRLLRKPVKGNVPAVSMFFDFLPIAEAKGYRIYLFGARPEVVEKATANIRREYPKIQIVGFHHGHYRADEESAILADIKAAQPHIVFVAMSTPQKERFIDTFKEQLGVPVMVGVGGTFDIAAGVTKLAPGWIRRNGIEWLYRLIQEPRRLWRRYATTHPAFIYLVARSFFIDLFRRNHEYN